MSLILYQRGYCTAIENRLLTANVSEEPAPKASSHSGANARLARVNCKKYSHKLRRPAGAARLTLCDKAARLTESRSPSQRRCNTLINGSSTLSHTLYSGPLLRQRQGVFASCRRPTSPHTHCNSQIWLLTSQTVTRASNPQGQGLGLNLSPQLRQPGT